MRYVFEGGKMVIEPTDFNVFGIRVAQENLRKIQSAMNETYNYLMKEDNKWEDVEFCKREIASLWEGIVEMLTRLSRESFREIGSNEIGTLLIIDRDNQEFLNFFGRELKRNGALDDVLGQLREIKIESGSLRIFFTESFARKMTEARIEIEKMLKQVQKESEKIKMALRHFVDWIRRNIRANITCSLVAGALIVSLVALSSIGASILGAKLFIMASLAVICLIYEAYGTYATITEVKRALSRRLGLSLKQ